MRNALASFNMILKAKKRRTRWIKHKTIEKKDLEEDSNIMAARNCFRNGTD